MIAKPIVVGSSLLIVAALIAPLHLVSPGAATPQGPESCQNTDSGWGYSSTICALGCTGQPNRGYVSALGGAIVGVPMVSAGNDCGPEISCSLLFGCVASGLQTHLDTQYCHAHNQYGLYTNIMVICVNQGNRIDCQKEAGTDCPVCSLQQAVGPVGTDCRLYCSLMPPIQGSAETCETCAQKAPEVCVSAESVAYASDASFAGLSLAPGTAVCSSRATYAVCALVVTGATMVISNVDGAGTLTSAAVLCKLNDCTGYHF